MKFNPNVHMSVVSNFRAMFKKEEPSLDLSTISDEEVWDTYDEWSMCEDDEAYPHMSNRYDASVLRGLKILVQGRQADPLKK